MPEQPENYSSLCEYANVTSMVTRLSAKIAASLKEAIQKRGRASLIVSGGSTPKLLFEELSTAEINWSKIGVALMDERWVEPGNPGSNEDFVHQTLLQNNAKKATYISLKTAHDHPASAIKEVEQRLSALAPPYDVAIFGLGPDGHTASWFPGSKGIDTALQTDGPMVCAIDAIRSEVTGDHLTRITMTRAALKCVGLPVMLLRGEVKRTTWRKACATGSVEEMPVRALIRDPDYHLQAYWSP